MRCGSLSRCALQVFLPPGEAQKTFNVELGTAVRNALPVTVDVMLDDYFDGIDFVVAGDSISQFSHARL